MISSRPSTASKLILHIDLYNLTAIAKHLATTFHMTPNIAKSHTDTSRFFAKQPESNMDGDHSAKTMDKGANAATNAMDQTDGLHEDAKQTVRCSEELTVNILINS